MITVYKWVPGFGTTTYGNFKDSRAVLTALRGSRVNQANPVFKEAMENKKLYIVDFKKGFHHESALIYHSSIDSLKKEYYDSLAKHRAIKS